MKLHPASEEDCRALLVLAREQMSPYFERQGLEWDEQKREARLRESEVYRIVDPDLRGYLQLGQKDDKLFLFTLHILPEHQGNGLGTAVVSEIKRMASERGCSALRLGSFKSNRASELYKRLGFEVFKENDFFEWLRCDVRQDIQ
jgi:ribosomal protein S18 acetylase RimI-like enzyme